MWNTDPPLTPGSSEPRLAHHFRAVKTAFDRAAAVAGLHEVAVELAGFRLVIRAAGRDLAPAFLRALAHAAIPVPAAGAGRDLVIHAFDSASTGVPLPDLSWEGADTALEGGITATREGTTGILTLLDEERNEALHWIRDARRLPHSERTAPLRAILACWMSTRGCHLVHAAAVGSEDGAAILAGKGGAGKSSTALQCLLAGMDLAGEDYVALSAGAGLRVHAIYRSAKVDPSQRVHFGPLGPPEEPGGPGEKAVYFLGGDHPGRVVASMPLRAILVPRVTGERETRVTSITTMEGLGALLPSSVMQIPALGRGGVQAIGRWMKGLPCFRLELGSDRSAIPGVIRELLREAR